jgi:hypothetical protein
MLVDVYVAWLVCQERKRDELREADRYRLVQLALAGRPRRPRYLPRALAWFGHRLVVWGRGLEQRYGRRPRIVHPLSRPSELAR